MNAHVGLIGVLKDFIAGIELERDSFPFGSNLVFPDAYLGVGIQSFLTSESEGCDFCIIYTPLLPVSDCQNPPRFKTSFHCLVSVLRTEALGCFGLKILVLGVGTDLTGDFVPDRSSPVVFVAIPLISGKRGWAEFARK